MPAARQWTAEQTATAINMHVSGATTRAIAAEVGRTQSAVSRLLRAPDMAKIIEEQRGKRDTHEDAAEKQAEQDRARIERLARDRQRKQRERAIKASVREGTPQDRAERQHGKTPAAEPERRSALSHPIMSFETRRDGRGYEHWQVHGDGSDFTLADYLDRNDAPIQDERAIRVEYDDGKNEVGGFGLRLGSDDTYDKQDIADAIHRLAKIFDRPRTEITSAIYATERGRLCRFEVEPEPEPAPTTPLDDQHLHPPGSAHAPDMFSEQDLHADGPD